MNKEKRFQEILEEMKRIGKRINFLIKEATECCDHPSFRRLEGDEDLGHQIITMYQCLKCGKWFTFDKDQPSFEAKIGKGLYLPPHQWPFEENL